MHSFVPCAFAVIDCALEYDTWERLLCDGREGRRDVGVHVCCVVYFDLGHPGGY